MSWSEVGKAKWAVIANYKELSVFSSTCLPAPGFDQIHCTMHVPFSFTGYRKHCPSLLAYFGTLEGECQPVGLIFINSQDAFSICKDMHSGSTKQINNYLHVPGK